MSISVHHYPMWHVCRFPYMGAGMKLVHIEWTDAHHHAPGEWVNPDEIRPGVKVITVGFLLSDRHKHYTVAATIDEAGSATGVFSIPKACVRRYTVIAP